jgi:hypothetical protein
MTKDEALLLALEALEYMDVTAERYVDKQIPEKAITAIKEALAQRTWVGLTDEEQQQAYEQWQNDGWGVFYNAIEAKLKEKNT